MPRILTQVPCGDQEFSAAQQAPRQLPHAGAYVVEAKAAPALLPRPFDGIADRRPPYPSGEANAGQR
ncbi:hypothetical protein ACGFZR_07645 [Streptomyces sp. NPDC048241]|uniref:hypothetical protein n=1 Tax=Streptomyces sp. NPDC048241 TaxID=3365521 RepID=UPI003717F5C3